MKNTSIIDMWLAARSTAPLPGTTSAFTISVLMMRVKPSVHSASRIDHVTSHARLPSPRALGRLNSLGSRTFRSSACGLTQISGEEAW